MILIGFKIVTSQNQPNFLESDINNKSLFHNNILYTGFYAYQKHTSIESGFLQCKF